MDNHNKKISPRVQTLKVKFLGESIQQDNLQWQSKLILWIVSVTAFLLVLAFLQTVALAISNSHGPNDPNISILAADLSVLLSPLAIIVSILMAAYLTLNQLAEKVNRDKVEHAHNLCLSAPDINIVFASIGPLNNHLEEAYRNCIEASQRSESTFSIDDRWELFVAKMEEMAEHFPSVLKSIARSLQADHRDDVSKIFDALAFLEKTASAVCDKHADDQVFWSRYNVAGFSIWIYSFPIIIDCWSRHTNSKYLNNSDSFGVPYEYFEAWLWYHSGKDGNKELNMLMNRLSRIREKVLEIT